MGRADEPTVLVPTADEGAIAVVEAGLRERDVAASVRPLPDLPDLFDVLGYEAIHCLLLPPAVDGTSATDVARGVSGLYPDLPIVVAGEPASSVSGERRATVVDADSLADEPVLDQVAAELRPPAESDAARPPSRMETMLLSMFDQLPIHAYAKDADARHLLVSRYANEPTDLIGITDLEYTELPPDHRAAAYRDDLRVIEDEVERLEIEEYTNYVDTHVLTSKVPWYGPDGDVIGLVGHTRDITERKRREHTSRRQQELLVRVALVAAHELRNELQVAAGRLELAESDPDQLAVVEQSLARLSKIVDKVIELASAERTERSDEPIWISTLSREVWNTLEPGDATLEVAGDGLLETDRESISLFVQVLFRNALQHCRADVTVTVGATTEGFFVADDGDGIDAEPPERAFDAGYTTADDGTGFGLYVAHSIGTEHDWDISIAESETGGARFEVSGLERRE